MNSTFLSRVVGLLLSGVLLVGCGGSSTPDADPAGYYTNTGMATINADTMPLEINDLQGMATSTELMMVSANRDLAYEGVITVSGNSFSGSVTVYENGVATQFDAPMSGTITQGSRIDGTLSGNGVANGTFMLLLGLPADNGPVDISMVTYADGWVPISNTDNFSITIDDSIATEPNINTGTPVSGTFDSCNFSGRIEPIVGKHLYTVSGTMSMCTNPNILTNASYSGTASVRGSAPNDRFVLVLTNGTYGINGEFGRQF